MKNILCSLFLLLTNCAIAQVLISPLPNPGDVFRLEDIWRLNVIIGGDKGFSGNLTLNIEDSGHNLVLASELTGIYLNIGNNSITGTQSQGKLIFGNVSAASVLRQTGALPYGEYIICYKISDGTSNKPISEYCYEKSVKPMLPPELLLPFNEEEIYTCAPLLVWKGPFPVSTASTTYQLRLTEVKKGQSSMTAIERNTPLFKRNIQDQTQLLYPPEAPVLEVGKTYVWQISASTRGYLLGTTEAWVFTVKQESVSPRNDSYRLLSSKPGANVFVAKNGILRFAYDNRYQESALDYAIKGLNSTDNKRMNELPSVILKEGVNRIEIDFNGQLEDGTKYLIQIHNKNGSDEYLEFLFRKDN